MDRNAVIMVTGAAGFIGSCLAGYLNRKGYSNLILVDDFGPEEKKRNYDEKKIYLRVEREELFAWLKGQKVHMDFVFHMGARTDTMELDYLVHERLNVQYSKQVWEFCSERKIPLVYASSAATYGSGELGYKDDHKIVQKLKPLNPYGVSKNEFDKWAVQQKIQPPFWAGLKFFNVYGPNEYHKERMASVIFHSFKQIKDTGKVKLFKSHNADYRDGEQLRDFIYVKDVVNICFWLMQNQPSSGLYNVGTGEARTFKDLVTAIYSSVAKPSQIEFIDTPVEIRDKYQYFTEADMSKLKTAGYSEPFYSLEKGVDTYVKNFLLPGSYY